MMAKTGNWLLFLAILLQFLQILVSTGSYPTDSLVDIPTPTPQGITFKKSLDNQLQLSVNKNEPPFELFITTFQDKLGMELQFKIKNQYLGELHNIYFGAVFPRCQDYLQFYVDLRDWPLGSYGSLQTPENGAKYVSYLKIARPSICLKDLGVDIPYTTACLYFADISVMPRGVYGVLKADLSFGISALQWKFQGIILFFFFFLLEILKTNCSGNFLGLELWKFTLGNVSACFTQTSEEGCLSASSNSNGACGWCADTGNGFGRCFQTRKGFFFFGNFWISFLKFLLNFEIYWCRWIGGCLWILQQMQIFYFER